MANEWLRTAMFRHGVTSAELAETVGVDVKTVTRWMGGRVPHRQNRLAVAQRIGEPEENLWPAARPDVAPGAAATAEVLVAWGRRADVPQHLWAALLAGAIESIDVLGYAAPFIFELDPRLPATLKSRGVKVRVALADPDCEHVGERDALEQLGGTLPGRIRNAITMLDPVRGLPNVQVGLHKMHLYNSVFRFDDEMIVTPYLIRARGYQHTALHLRRLSPFGIFESFAHEFEEVWASVRLLGQT
jgi:transcriptional regulator with XRE-family HTH domain